MKQNASTVGIDLAKQTQYRKSHPGEFLGLVQLMRTVGELTGHRLLQAGLFVAEHR